MFFGQLLSMPSFEDCCLTCAVEELPAAGNLQLSLRPCKNFSPLHNCIQLRYLCPISNKACLNLYTGQNVGYVNHKVTVTIYCSIQALGVKVRMLVKVQSLFLLTAH